MITQITRKIVDKHKEICFLHSGPEWTQLKDVINFVPSANALCDKERYEFQNTKGDEFRIINDYLSFGPVTYLSIRSMSEVR